MAILKQTSSFLIGGLEDLFERWGKLVTNHPWPVIIGSIVFTAICSVGFIKFSTENRAEMLWIPGTSDYITNLNWLDHNFQKNNRHQMTLFHADNVLTPDRIKQMFYYQKSINEIQVDGKKFSDICSRIPIADIFHSKRRKRRQILDVRKILDDSGSIVETSTITDNSVIDDTETTTVTHNSVTDNTETATNTYSSVTDNELMADQDLVGKEPGNEDSTTENASSLEDIEEDYDYDNYDYDSLWQEYEEDDTQTDENETQTTRGKSFIDFKKFGARNKSSYESSYTDDLPSSIYCDLINTLDDKCFFRSLLEMWKFDEEGVVSATQQDILDAVNLVEYSPWFGYKHNYSSQLGGIQRNASGHIVGASTATLTWMVNVPDDAILVQSQGAGLELERADALTLAWEQKYLDISLNVSLPGVTLYPNAAKSFADISAEAIFFDVIKMACGYLIMFAFTMCMLGRMDRVEVRMYLAMVGILSVAMGMVIAVGLTSALGYPYTPMHAMLPFLCLGIGIDDMFVIVQCWTNLKKDPRAAGLPLAERIGKAMRHAGVSVTVTSLTDVFAFGVGAVTKMPGLESFCVCCAIALGSIFLLQVSWFVAWMSLDERRIESGRDGIIPCIVHKDYQPPACTRQINGQAIVSSYAKLLSSRIYKGCVLIFTAGLLGFGIWGAILIRTKFDPMLLMPSDSYLRKWVDLAEEDYPQNGWPTDVYTGPLDHTQLHSMDNLANNLTMLVDEGKYLKEVDLWWTALKDYAKEKKNYSHWEDFSNPEDFSVLLSNFLFSSQGANYKPNFKFDGDLICNEPAPKVTASKFSFDYLVFDGPEEHIPARHAIRDIVQAAGFNITSFSHVKIYAAWETDEIIGFELWRNIGLAMLCVFIITFLLLANLPICLMVFICVVLTLVDIVGLLYFWEITIDAISMVNIVLAVGLCVDYSVHIAHAFLIAPGTREERAMETLTSIGPAVFNGGITTFLALILLGFSTSHVFITFFKVFLLTVLFGLFHGLVFLPVLLSLVGPESTSKDDKSLRQSEGTVSTEAASWVETSPNGSGTGSPDTSGTSSPDTSSSNNGTRSTSTNGTGSPSTNGTASPRTSGTGSPNASGTSSPGTSGANSPGTSPSRSDTGGKINANYIADATVDMKCEKLESPWIKNVFSKKASWNLETNMMY